MKILKSAMIEKYSGFFCNRLLSFVALIIKIVLVFQLPFLAY